MFRNKINYFLKYLSYIKYKIASKQAITDKYLNTIPTNDIGNISNTIITVAETSNIFGEKYIFNITLILLIKQIMIYLTF